MKEGISATSFIDNIEYTTIMRPHFSIKRWLSEKRNTLLYSFQKSLSPQAFTLFASLFLGEKELSKKHKDEIRGPFKQWGISHYLARSGLHLVIIASLSELFFRYLPIPFFAKQLVSLLMIFAYFLLTWPTISFLRAFAIFVIYKLCILYRTPTHFLHILFLCCLTFLIANPFHLFFLDFQLSFGFTFALAWLNQFKTITPSPLGKKY